MATVIAQSRTDWRHIIVDNGSPEPAALASAVRAVAAAAPGDAASRVTLHRNARTGQPSGVADGRNFGISLGSADFVAFLDDDDLWEPDYLEQLVGALEARPDAVAAYCGGRYVNSAGVAFGGWTAEEATADQMLRGMRPTPRIVALIVRRSAGEAAGWFDPAYDMGEDNEFIYRLMRTGEFIAVPATLVSYRRHAGNTTAAPGARKAMREAGERYLTEHIRAARAAGDHTLAHKLRQNRRRARHDVATVELRALLHALHTRRGLGEALQGARWVFRHSPGAFVAACARRMVTAFGLGRNSHVRDGSLTVLTLASAVLLLS